VVTGDTDTIAVS